MSPTSQTATDGWESLRCLTEWLANGCECLPQGASESVCFALGSSAVVTASPAGTMSSRVRFAVCNRRREPHSGPRSRVARCSLSSASRSPLGAQICLSVICRHRHLANPTAVPRVLLRLLLFLLVVRNICLCQVCRDHSIGGAHTETAA
eukprot:Selendium_serpulae@DN2464_c0_g1_i1.p2